MEKPPLSHAAMHVKCMFRMLKERVLDGKHKGRVWERLKFFGKGVLRSFGVGVPKGDKKK